MKCPETPRRPAPGRIPDSDLQKVADAALNLAQDVRSPGKKTYALHQIAGGVVAITVEFHDGKYIEDIVRKALLSHEH